MIAKGTIVWVFLNSHNLYAVVTVLNDTRQYIILEFAICTHLLSILCHTDMALVDEQRICVGLELLYFPLVRFRSPHLCAENLRGIVLNDALCPSGNAFSLTTVPMYAEFIKVAMLESILWKNNFPVA